MAEAKKPQNLKIYIVCTKGSLGPCVQPVLDAQTVFDTRHRNLLVEVYNNNGDLQDVVKYDAVFDKDKKKLKREKNSSNTGVDNSSQLQKQESFGLTLRSWR